MLRTSEERNIPPYSPEIIKNLIAIRMNDVKSPTVMKNSSINSRYP